MLIRLVGLGRQRGYPPSCQMERRRVAPWYGANTEATVEPRRRKLPL